MFSSVAQSCPTLRPHGLQHARPPCPSPTPRGYPNSCPLSQWCRPTISSSVVPFSCLQSFPTSGSFQMSQLFTSGGQSIRVSASTSVLPMNPQDWSPLGWTGWISLQSKGLSRVFSNTTYLYKRISPYNSTISPVTLPREKYFPTLGGGITSHFVMLVSMAVPYYLSGELVARYPHRYCSPQMLQSLI